MEFIVSTKSIWDDEVPCEEAYIVKHETVNGDQREDWTIEIASLKELMEFVDKHREISIFSNGEDEDMRCPEIQIVDIYESIDPEKN